MDTAQQAHQAVDRRNAHPLFGLAQRGEWHLAMLAEEDIAEAGQGKIIGDAKILFAKARKEAVFPAQI